MDDHLDIRQQLFNEGRQGPASRIQLPLERITRLHGILFDLDPQLLVPGNPYFPPADEPRAFHEGIRPVLERHPLACHAEVRSSGSGLHVIVWLDPVLEFQSAEEQQIWAATIKAVQCSLPADPDAPGITALTRAVGSINSKNDVQVEVLRTGRPVSPAEVTAFAERLTRSPFRTVAEILFGTHRVQPCPICERPRSRLDALDFVGKCYNGCSKAGLEQLYDVVLRPLAAREPCQP
jgi:hypothetical protein